MERAYVLLASAYAARCKERRHGITHSTLYRREVSMGFVWAAPGLPLVLVQSVIHCFEILRGNDTIRVEYNEIITSSLCITEITRWTGAGIGLEEVANVQIIAIAIYNVFTFNGRTVFDNNHFKSRGGFEASGF